MKHKNIAFFIPHVGCLHRCSFCNQRTISGTASPPDSKEVESVLRSALERMTDIAETEIAFFGGSFTAIPREYMLSLLEAAAPFIGKDRFCGIRISTRPDAVDEEVLELLKRYRVTSIELGAQSMEDGVLLANGRGHTAKDVREASRRIRKHGFSLGLQMMTGLYCDTAEGARKTAEELAVLSPDTMRIYPTVVLKGTQLAKLYSANEYEPMPLEEAVLLCADFLLYFRERGIRVIRLGLHASREVEEQMLAGAYHPAFKELCENRIYYRRACELLSLIGKPRELQGQITLEVNDRAVSKMIGMNKANLDALKMNMGLDVKIVGNSAVALYDIKVKL